MHSFDDLADDISTLLKNRGYMGYRGYKLENTSRNNLVAVTPCRAPMLPLEIEGLQPSHLRGNNKSESDQLVVNGVTPVTPVTRYFEEGEAANADNDFPPEWLAILAGLKERASPDWMMPDRWEVLLHDADRFLGRWSSTAHAMGWTALDLFGVHPTQPARRVDVMGLLLLVQGGEVIALTAEGALIRRASGAVLRFSRPSPGGVLLSEVAHV
ncbi:hypothetical protein [Nitrobacter vulgaris]|uniref:Uncharacterized protein n=1 Tax=Nitrobacter vulgaris TaxID=29421 RepID=A0A1V4I1Y7_NITVU|nr:hypothetical protein [Nitrobacter vulgaris]OPH84129.1 hypothetical protein B2M20_03055 [Nitrobacter vulgaris]